MRLTSGRLAILADSVTSNNSPSLTSGSVRSKGLLFEVTESAKIGNLLEVNRVIQELRRAGHSVCLDDFGAGEAAFQYLGALEVDIVKLDGAYIHKALISRRGKAVLKAMASMCGELGITAVAEMIETKEHLDLVRDCGIGFGQGYYLGQPNTNLSAFDAPRPVTLIGAAKTPSAGPYAAGFN